MHPTCQLTVQTLAQCREVLSRFHRMEQAEQWLVAGFLGVGLLLVWIASQLWQDRSFGNAVSVPHHRSEMASD